jgi:phage tail-like protein
MVSNNYAVCFYFVLLFRGEKIAFQEISGISAELNVEEVICGGENRFKYKLPTVVSGQNLVLKRALVPVASKLVDWCKGTIGGGLVNKIEPADISVYLLNEESYVSLKWVFHNAYPVKYFFSELKSQESGLVIETMEMAFTYFESLPVKPGSKP